MRTLEEVNHAFSPVPKLDPAQSARMLKCQMAYLEVAQQIVDLVPECADRTAALRLLLESKMTCTQAITHSWSDASVKKTGRNG